MNPPIVNGDNGDPPYKAKSMFELWCDYDKATKDAGAKALGLMVFKLFDGQQELRHKSNRNWNAILTLSAVTSIILTVLVGHTYGVGV
jgi:hypothetical protein